MKRHYPIGLFLLLALLASCSSAPEPERSLSPSKGRRAEGPTPKLSSIDSLMWQQPDSALRALMAYEGDASEYNHHYAQLLTSELLYKNDYEQTNRRELQQAVVYFDSLLCQFPPLQRGLGGFKTRPDQTNQIAFLAARAHYINGVGYYERDSVIEACREYLKALEVMEGHFEEKEMVGKKARFIVLTYNRLGELFSAQFMTESAIVCGKEVLHFCKTAPASPYSVSNALYYIGKQYDIKNEKDSASYYYAKAIDFIPDTSNLFYRNMVTSKALLDYQLNHQIASPLRELHKVANQAKDEDERLTRYFIIGDIYFEEGMYDSALRYLDSVFQNKDNASIRMQVADYLRIIYDSVGDVEKADTYMRFLTQNKLTESDDKAQVSELSDMFQAHKLRHFKEQSKREKTKIAWKTIKIVGFLSILFVGLFLVVMRHKGNKRIQMKESSHNAVLKRLQNTNSRLRAENQRLLEQQEKTPHQAKPHKAPSMAFEALLHEEICMDLLHRFGKTEILTTNKPSYYANLAATSKDKRLLVNAVEKHCPDFGPLLKTLDPDLTSTDFEVCRFLLIGLSEPQVAVLLQKDYSTIWKRTKMLKECMNTVELKHRLVHVLFEI